MPKERKFYFEPMTSSRGRLTGKRYAQISKDGLITLSNQVLKDAGFLEAEKTFIEVFEDVSRRSMAVKFHKNLSLPVPMHMRVINLGRPNGAVICRFYIRGFLRRFKTPPHLPQRAEVEKYNDEIFGEVYAITIK